MNPLPQASIETPEAVHAIRTRPGQLDRVRRLDKGLIDAALLAALVIGAATLYMVYALRVHSFQPDEWYYMELARVIAGHFPAGLWQHGIYWRGIQRIDQLVLAAPFAILRGAAVYEVAHAIQALLFASTAIPVWLLARAAGLRIWARALAATIVLAVPWAIVSTAFLTESAAYPTYAWVLYTTWRAARVPGYRRELLALTTIALAALSRTALLAMGPILPLTLLWQQWRWELREKPLIERLRALPTRIWTNYRIVTGVTTLAIAAYALSVTGALPGGGLASLTGNYGLPGSQALSGLLGRWDYYLSRMEVGTGGIALALGFAWALRELVRPEDGRRHALAVISVLGVAIVLFSLLQGGPDERYVLYGAVPIGLAFAAELDATWTGVRVRPRSAAIVAVSTLAIAVAAVILLMGAEIVPPLQNAYEFFSYPAASFYSRVVLTRIGDLPLSSHLPQAVLGAVAVGWALTLRWRRIAQIAVPLAAVAVLAVCGVELGYSLEKFTTSAAAAGPDASQRSWLERDVPAGAEVGAVGIGLGQTGDYVPIWRTSEFWNPAIQVGIAFQPWDMPTIPFNTEGHVVAVEGPSGRLEVTQPTTAEVGHKLTLPRYLLLPEQATNPDGFSAKVIANDPSLPLTLVRLSEPARLDWSLAGTSEEGFMSPGQPARATVYGGAIAAGAGCASFSLIGPPAFLGHWPYIVSSGRTVLHGSLVALKTRVIEVPLHPVTVPHGKLAEVTIRVHGGVPYPNGRTVSARVASVAVGRCRTRPR